MKSYLYGLILNLQFFSTIPIHKEIPLTARNLKRAIHLFPALGIFQGVIYSGLLFFLLQYTNLSVLAVSFILLFSMILLTGGIHLDGWMDFWDAYFSYQDKEKRLLVMEDPRIGSFGVISILILLGAKFLFIFEVIQMVTPLSYIFILIIPIFSKILMGLMLLYIPPVKRKGLGFLFYQADKSHTIYYYIAFIGIILIGFGFWESKSIFLVL